MSVSMNRAEFLKSACAATAGAAALAAAPVVARADESAWTAEADVVVIGAGTGLYTALRAQTSGLSTIVLEKNGFCGGSSLFSSSVVWVPGNDVMTAEGIDDSREEALTYLEAGAGDTFIPELAGAFLDVIGDVAHNVEDLTGEGWACWVGGIDYRPELPGGKTYGRSLVPASKEGNAATAILASNLEAACHEAGVEFMMETPAKAFMTEEAADGTVRVIGVRAEGPEGTVLVKANQAVVLASGGFDWNQEMMATYLRCPVKYTWGGPYSTGDGHHMAARIGADFRFMNDAWMSPGYVIEREAKREEGSAMFSTAITDYGKPGLIYVNKHGNRFVNECSNYDSIGRSFVCLEEGIEPRGWANLPAFAICDQACVDAYGLAGGQPGEPGASFAKYDSLEELAAACGIDEEGLLAAVERFNDNASEGVDPDFGRGQDYFGQNYQRVDLEKDGAFRTLAPLTQAPFWAAEIAPTILGTMGGVKVDERARAIDVEGNVIEGLYAQGNCAGVGIGGAFYCGGGGTLAPAMAFGELAVRDILGE